VTLEQVNWLVDPPPDGAELMIQCRYRAAAVPAEVTARTGDGLSLRLSRPVRAVTPGQSGVLYAGNGRLLGGGVIA
jgi:tRNA U34 2-thiouridine synthase MnmA/TrmU